MTSATVPGGLEARPPAGRSASNGKAQTPAEIEAEIEATRVRLAGTVDAISDRVKPSNVARRCLASVKAQFVEPDGRPRATRVAVLAAVAGCVVAARLWRRRR
jgi:hypothetical protein